MFRFSYMYQYIQYFYMHYAKGPKQLEFTFLVFFLEMPPAPPQKKRA